MPSIREEGSINENIELIDSGMNHLEGLGAVYLVHSGKSCLIDGGTKEGAAHIVKSLKKLGQFPPDYIVLTHSHWDHCQGVNHIRKEAGKAGKSITVYAGEKACANLENQSYNRVFEPKGKYENISGAQPLKDGDVIDLDPLKLKVIEVPGHHTDHIALFDENSGILFSGDSLGIKMADDVAIPTFMPPFCDKQLYFDSIELMKRLSPKGICLAHYGYIKDEVAENHFDQIRESSIQWWNILKSAEEKGVLDNIDALAETISESTTMTPHAMEQIRISLNSASMRAVLAMINSFRIIFRKKALTPSDMFLPVFLQWTVEGYKSCHIDPSR